MAGRKTAEVASVTPLTEVETAYDAASEAVETAAESAAEHAAAAADTVHKLNIEVTGNMEKAMKTAEDLVSFGQGNLEAFAKAGQIWVTGVQDLGKQVAATAQAQLDQTVATFKALAAAKSFKEAVDLQSTLARSTVETAVAETGKLTDASLKLTEQTLAPITARWTLAIEKFGRPAV
jgi:phasin family protein